MSKIHIAFVLNAHLPFVRQPDYPRFLEERWLFEALTETYLPLVRAFDRLDADQVPYALTLAVSPTLISMLGDPLLNERYASYLAGQVEFADREIARHSGDEAKAAITRSYRALYAKSLEEHAGKYSLSALEAFKALAGKRNVEFMVSGATNAFLPAYAAFPEAICAQIELAAMTFRNAFGTSPSGFWVPQLGWFPGLQNYLRSYNFDYTVVSTDGALRGAPTPVAGSYAPLSCRPGFDVFVRDFRATNAVWSETEGYPADSAYRDFYRDVGYELPPEELERYFGEGQIRSFTGFKYWAITGRKDDKRLWDEKAARAKAREHAENFVYSRILEARRASKYMRRPPLIVCPYDAELFGHWWFEGVEWIEQVFRVAALESEVCARTLTQERLANPPTQTSIPDFSTWGEDGFATPWIDGSNDWVYRHTFKMIERMVELAERFPDESGLKERILNQAARETMLAIASDWPFLLRAGKSTAFAQKQIEEAVGNFNRIYEMLCGNTVGTEWITKLEKKNNIFPFINYRIFRKKR